MCNVLVQYALIFTLILLFCIDVHFVVKSVFVVVHVICNSISVWVCHSCSIDPHLASVKIVNITKAPH